MFIFSNIFLLSYFSNFLSLIFTNLSYLFLKLFFDVNLVNNSIIFSIHQFLIVDSCVGISAYILLTFLFFSLNINKKTLFKCWSYSIILFTIANFLRIILLMITFILFGKNFFESIHLLFFEFLTGVLVALIFLYFYKKFKIKQKPLIDDYIYLFSKFKKK